MKKITIDNNEVQFIFEASEKSIIISFDGIVSCENITPEELDDCRNIYSIIKKSKSK